MCHKKMVVVTKTYPVQYTKGNAMMIKVFFRYFQTFFVLLFSLSRFQIEFFYLSIS